MTLVLGTQHHTGGAKTHVLIIGVGRYKHLPDGPGPLTPNVPQLGQLQSPPVSARKLADWFIGGAYRNPQAPLGSVELLLSDASSQQYAPPDGSPAKDIEHAEIKNIMRAFNEWYARCNADENNVCFFYFCGHGLEKGSTILLPEDFAAFPNNWWFTSIDFNRTYNGMRQCAAKTQYYVVDACRQWTTGIMQDWDVYGQTLMTMTSLANIRERTAPRLFATAVGLPAFGDDKDGVSRLTAALLECLEGGGAEKQNGRWLVSTSSLGEAVQKLVNLKNAALPRKDWQDVDPAGGDAAVGPRVLHMLPDGAVPEVLVTLDCSPDAARPSACFYFKRQGQRQDAPEAGLWSMRLKAGVYDFGVYFPQRNYRDWLRSEESIRPPVWPVTLEV